MSGKRKKRVSSRRKENPVKVSTGRLGVVLIAVFLLCLAHLNGMNRTLELAQHVEDMQKACDELQRSVDRLTLEIAEESGGGRVVELARQRLGMIFPQAQTEVLAVLPAATRRGGSPWTYIENALAMASESLQHQLSPSAQAREVTAPDSSRGH
jgi:cell division protein FtsL